MFISPELGPPREQRMHRRLEARLGSGLTSVHKHFAVGISMVKAMRNAPKTSLRVACWCAAIVSVLFILLRLSGYPEGYCYFYPSVGTRFTPGFSEFNFAKVKPGMSQSDVQTLLGQPLFMQTNRKGIEEWYYSLDNDKGFDVAWLVRIVEFTNGIVLNTVKTIEYN
jgi:hypothetical protein